MRNAVKSSLVLGVIFSMGLALSFASCGAPSTCASLTCDDGGSGGGDGGKHDGSDASVADSGFDASVVADSGFDASVAADSGFDASVADSGADASADASIVDASVVDAGVDASVSDGAVLLFHSGYEGTVTVVSAGAQADKLTGVDSTLPAPNSWAEFEKDPHIGSVSEAGDTTQRQARVIAEPGNPTNHVLQFWLPEPNVPALDKGRVQMDVYGNKGLDEVYVSSRIFLPSDFEAFRTYPGVITWLTLAQIWNNGQWTSEGYPFRITLDLTKPSATVPSALFLHVHAQTIDIADGGDGGATFTVVWDASDTTFPVPSGQWFQFELYFKQGNASSGRFYAAVTPAGGAKQVVFDVHNVTHHPDDPAPNGFGHFNPQKLYTSAKLIEHFKSQGAVPNVLWDDFELWTDRRP